MSDTSKASPDLVTQQTETPREASVPEAGAAETEDVAVGAAPHLDDLFGDYSEQTGAFFG